MAVPYVTKYVTERKEGQKRLVRNTNGTKNPKEAEWEGKMEGGSDIEDIKFACGPRHPILFDISSNSLR